MSVPFPGIVRGLSNASSPDFFRSAVKPAQQLASPVLAFPSILYEDPPGVPAWAVYERYRSKRDGQHFYLPPCGSPYFIIEA